MPGGFSASRPHGEAEWADRERDRKVARDCLQCCHCGGHFFVCPGSGRRRGWCHNCAQVTCGRPSCDPCCHWKKKHELIEAGKAPKAILVGLPFDAPVSVSVPEMPTTAGGIILGKE